MSRAMSKDAPATTAAGREAALAEKSDAVCRMGAMMLTAGTGSYRVKSAMGRVADALGIEQLQAQVSLNEIVATTRARGAFRTQVVEVPVPVVNADRIAALMRVSLRASPGLSAAELHGQLDRLQAQAHYYPRWVIVAGATVACAAFAVLHHGRWQTCLAAGLAAGCGKAIQLLLSRFRLNPLAGIVVAATVAALACVLLADALQGLFPAPGWPAHQVAIISAILFLVPGFPLLTAALDLARFDFPAGMARLLYATMITLSAALGAWVVIWAFALAPAPSERYDVGAVALVLIRVVASFIAVLGFAVTFNTPLQAALVAATVGATVNVLRLGAVDAGGNRLLCAWGATLLIGLLAAATSQRLATPRIIVSVPAVLIMIPGTDTYRALVATINNDPLEALSSGFAALGIVVALAGGLAVARMITDPAWNRATPEWTHMPRTHAQVILQGGGPASRRSAGRRRRLRVRYLRRLGTRRRGR